MSGWLLVLFGIVLCAFVASEIDSDRTLMRLNIRRMWLVPGAVPAAALCVVTSVAWGLFLLFRSSTPSGLDGLGAVLIGWGFVVPLVTRQRRLRDHRYQTVLLATLLMHLVEAPLAAIEEEQVIQALLPFRTQLRLTAEELIAWVQAEWGDPPHWTDLSALAVARGSRVQRTRENRIEFVC